MQLACLDVCGAPSGFSRIPSLAPLLRPCSLADLGGLSDQIGQLRDKILRPLESPDVYCTPLLGVSRGILLYGPPGTGKTMLAQALAVETGAVFINVRASSLQNKWFGETNKLVAAVFSLAKKLQARDA